MLMLMWVLLFLSASNPLPVTGSVSVSKANVTVVNSAVNIIGIVSVAGSVAINGTVNVVNKVSLFNDFNDPLYVSPSNGAVQSVVYNGVTSMGVSNPIPVQYTGFSTSGFSNPLPVTSSVTNPFVVSSVGVVSTVTTVSTLSSVTSTVGVNVLNSPNINQVNNPIQISNFPTNVSVINDVTCSVVSLPDFPPIYYTNYLDGPRQGFYVPFSFEETRKLRK